MRFCCTKIAGELGTELKRAAVFAGLTEVWLTKVVASVSSVNVGGGSGLNGGFRLEK